MNLISIFKTFIKNTLNREKPSQVVKTTTPMGLHQGSVVTFPELDFVLAEAEGGICTAPTGTMVIDAVGKYRLFDMNVYHCYFGNRETFLRLVTNPGSMTVEQATYFSRRSEIYPTTSEEWEIWLGSWQKDENGKVIRDDNGNPLKNEDGLIGFPRFQIDTDPPVIYDREWNSGDTSIDPVIIKESVLDSTGRQHYISYEAMEYSRKLSNDENSRSESLLASVVTDDNGAAICVFIGVPLDHSAIKVLVS